MKKLIDAGYGYLVKTCFVSIGGKNIINFWGCACPLRWISPSYNMETILGWGEFGKGTMPVMAQVKHFQIFKNYLTHSHIRSTFQSHLLYTFPLEVSYIRLGVDATSQGIAL